MAQTHNRPRSMPTLTDAGAILVNYNILFADPGQNEWYRIFQKSMPIIHLRTARATRAKCCQTQMLCSQDVMKQYAIMLY